MKDHTVVSIHLTSSQGDVYIDTGTFDPSDPGSTLPGLVNEEVVADQKYSSDVKICVPAKENQGNFGQSTAAYETVTLCGNWTPTQGQAFPFDDGYAHALGMYHGKPFVMRVDFFAENNKSTAFFASPAAHQILAGVVFKLYGAA